MTQRQLRLVVGAIFVAVPILINIPYTLLIVRFDYPDILRQPAGEILTRFHEGGAGLILTWWAFAIIGLPLIFSVIGLHQILHREDTPYLRAATVFGIVSCVAQMLGLLRWTFVVPILANTYADPVSSQATKDAASMVFQAVHQYGGVVIGEHVGQAFTIAWMLLVSAAMFRSPLFRAWHSWFGIVSALIYLMAQLELFATVIPQAPVIPAAGLIGSLLWLVWLILIGVNLVTLRGAEHRNQERNDAVRV
jgi:hypothetical protein